MCRNVVLPVTLLLWLAGCHRWVQLVTPETALREAADAPSAAKFRIYRADDAVIEGRPVETSADSVVLFVGGDSMAVAFGDIISADVRETRVVATIFLIAGVFAAPFVLYGVALGIACSGQGEKCLS